MRRRRNGDRCVLTMALAATAGFAQTDWRPLFAVNTRRCDHAMAFDVARGVTVAFGGRSSTSFPTLVSATAVWDGRLWRAANPPIEPAARRGHAMAYDLARARVVLFGGFNFGDSAFADTWEWDGVAWRQQTPANSPTARGSTAMAYDAGRQRMVLFGGTPDGLTRLADTWEWDGINWIPRLTAVTPPARLGHAAAYDLARGRTVVFGGQVNDVWEWDGNAWSNPAPAIAPPARVHHAMAFDLVAGKTLVLGGEPAAGGLLTGAGDLWSWDGFNWQRLTTSSPSTTVQPTALIGCAMAHDFVRSRTVVSGGFDGFSCKGSTLEWDGTQWLTLNPPPLSWSAIALDPVSGRGILFGGARESALYSRVASSETWEWSNGAWTLLHPAATPPARVDHSMACDTARRRTVLFGGFGVNSTTLGDTWLWDGAQWSAPPLGVSPSPRMEHAMTFDSVRQEVILFGGRDSSLRQDTWTWNGTAWQQRNPASQPSPRYAAGFAFDAARGRAVLVGGLGAQPTDTWEWDGANWLLRSPAHSPQVASTLAFDAARRRCVMISDAPLWEWDGVDWIARTPPAPRPTSGGLAAYDARTGRVLRIGVDDGIWDYGPVQPATIAAFGTGCAGSAGTPVLRADNGSLPWLGDTLALVVEPVPANVPVLLAIGFSNTTFGGAALPLSLDAIGITGCSLLVSIDEQRLAFATGARADFALAVPTTTALAGLPFFAQAGVADAVANPAGIIVSNALEGRIGSK